GADAVSGRRTRRPRRGPPPESPCGTSADLYHGLVLPPGPPLPRALQTLAFIVRPMQFINACRRRYGDVVTFGTSLDAPFVMVFDPELIKRVFQGPHDGLHAGEANSLLGAVVGERSLLLL